ncbi:MAG: ABC transporter ATP-binding protein [Desulfobulbaceae bacterium]|nr:ABC transporter ATP-binding protein [Desulfobulbaceae bacterium]
MLNYGYSEEGVQVSVGDLTLWRRILTYSAHYRGAMTLAVLLALAVSISTLIMPQLMQRGIDHYILATDLASDTRVQGLGRIVMQYGMLVVLVFVCTFAQMVLLEWVGQSVMHRMRQDLFVHLLGLDLRFFHSQPAGRLVTRLTNDIQNMHEMFTSVMVVLFNEALKLAGIFVFLFWMNARLAMAMLIFAPIALGATWLFSRLARDRFRDIRIQLAKINAFLAENLGGISVIQAFDAQLRSSAHFHRLNQEYLHRTFSQIKVFGIFMPFTEMLGVVAIAVIVWYGGGEALRGSLTIGELAAFITYMRLFFQPLRELSQNYSIVQSAMASAERIFETLDARSEILLLLQEDGASHPADATLQAAKGCEIEYRGVDFGYRADELVLRGVNLTIAPGETVALVGATGAGKTSMISLLIRFYDPVRGAVLICGQDIRTMPLAQLRRRIGLVMQDIFIMPDTVLANIILDQTHDEARLDDILAQTGLHRFIDRLPQGLQTRIGEGALNLSLGEKQLLSFVRALYRNPEILVLDEATASIDSESENLLEQAVAAGFANRSSLVIAHRLSTIRRANRIVVMDQGRIVEIGSHDELLSRDSYYRKLVHIDLQSS